MKTPRKPGPATLGLLLAGLMAVGAVAPAYADRDDREHHERHERFDRPYRSDHWVLDARFHHNHYYPALGYSVSVLPPGHLDIGLRGGHLFFQAGVWFRPARHGYVVVTPPFGVAIPVLPPDYSTVWYQSTPYYYANGVYYMAGQGGYTVVAPPPDDAIVMQPPPPPVGMPPAPPPNYAPPAPAGAQDGLMVYPRNGQSAAQMASDRAQCTDWAVNQTGYDPLRSPPADSRRADFQRAAGACLDARGYTAR